jgi:hypothetical protein
VITKEDVDDVLNHVMWWMNAVHQRQLIKDAMGVGTDYNRASVAVAHEQKRVADSLATLLNVIVGEIHEQNSRTGE